MYTVVYKTYMGGVESYAYRRFINRASATTFARKTGGKIEKS
jgi:nitrous oxide reductase accessory protein NosL